MRKYLLLMLLPINFVVLGCSSEDEDKGLDLVTSGRVLIANSGVDATGQIGLDLQVLDIDETEAMDFTDSQASPISQRSAMKTASELKLTKIGSISPPISNGVTLQASDILVLSSLAFVAYNVQGEQFLGAVQIIDISNRMAPEIIAEMILLDADVHGLTKHGAELYLAIGVDPDKNEDFSTPAGIEKIVLSNGSRRFKGSAGRVDLPSFAATDVILTHSYLVVTSGDVGGGASLINRSSFAFHQFLPSYDARGVSRYKGGKVALISGQPGRIDILNTQTLSFEQNFPVAGASTPESKSTIQMVGSVAFVGAGEGGVQVVDVETGQLRISIPQRHVPGLSLQDTVSNAITVDRHYGFVACGQAGISVVYFNKSQLTKTDFDSSIELSSPESLNARLVGQIAFGVNDSVNMVDIRHNYAFAATGLGGVNIVLIEEN